MTMKASNNKENSDNTSPLCESHTLTALRQIGEICRSATSVDEMLQQSQQALCAIFSADRAWVLCPVSPDDGLFTIKSELSDAKWPGACEREITLILNPATTEVIQRCVDSKTAQTFNFVNDEFINQPALFKRFSVQTQLCVALTPEHSQPWLLGLQFCTERDAFSELDIQLFTEIAHQIEAAISTFQLRSVLHQSEQRFDTLIKHAPEATFLIDAEQGNIIDANINTEKLFNRFRHELLTSSLASLSPERQPDGNRSAITINDLIAKSIEGIVPSFEWSFALTQEKNIPCRVNLVRLPSQEKILIRGSIIDTTLQKQIELETQKLSTVLAQISDAVMITDEDGTIEYINQSFENITGYNDQDCIGKTPHILDSGNQTESFYKTLWDTIKSGESFSNIFLNRKKDNTIYYEEKTITPLRNDKGDVTHFISTARDVSGRMKVQEHLEFLAHHDVLTQLPNRAELTNRLNQELTTAKREGEQLAVLFLDLDKFKAINDSLGHDVGDNALQRVAKLLTKRLRKDTVIARFGGDEFVIILSGINNANEVGDVSQTILDAFVPPFMIDNHEVFLSASIGAAVYPHDGTDSRSLLRNAGIAAYFAKEHGRSTFNFYNTRMSDVADIRHDMETRLRHALENDEFHLLYQPLVDINTGQPIGAEALIRWQPEGDKPVSPLDFIPILEETGLIIAVGEWVIQNACQQLSEWHKLGADDFRMSINISSRQFRSDELESVLKHNIETHHLNAADIDLEITESLLLDTNDDTISLLDRISEMGFALSIDDFGTGYSSLSYLKRLPITTLKIDRTFVHDMQTVQDSTTLVEAIVAMAKSLRMNIIVEGVETEQQLALLSDMGCEVAQGYYFSKPVEAEAFSQLMVEKGMIN